MATKKKPDSGPHTVRSTLLTSDPPGNPAAMEHVCSERLSHRALVLPNAVWLCGDCRVPFALRKPW